MEGELSSPFLAFCLVHFFFPLRNVWWCPLEDLSDFWQEQRMGEGGKGTFLTFPPLLLPFFAQIPNPNSFIVDMDALKIGPASSALSAATPAATPTAGEGGASDGNSGGGGGGLKDEPERMTGWNLLAQALDRLLFAVYLVIILVFIATFFGGAAANDTV